jgi:hypothetical protein
MAEEEYTEACEKLAESQRLDPATGTLLNLGACREKQGRLATAWAIFIEAEVAAKRDGRDDRVAFARERIDALEPRLSRLTIEVPEEARLDGLVVELDGSQVGEAAWGIPAPVDGGLHVIEARAPGRKAWKSEVDVAPEGDEPTVTLRVLELAEQDEAPAVTPDAEPARDRPTIPPAAESTNAPMDDTGTHRPLTVPIYLAGGVTVGLGAAALATGIVASTKKDDFDERNADPDASLEQREDARDDAQRAQVMNTVFAGAFVGGAVLTTVLVLTRPRKPRMGRNPRVTPWLTPSAGGLVVGGGL